LEIDGQTGKLQCPTHDPLVIMEVKMCLSMVLCSTTRVTTKRKSTFIPSFTSSHNPF